MNYYFILFIYCLFILNSVNAQDIYYQNEQKKIEDNLKSQKIKSKIIITYNPEYSKAEDSLYYKYDTYENIIEDREVGIGGYSDHDFIFKYKYDSKGNVIEKKTEEKRSPLNDETFIDSTKETFAYNDLSKLTEYKKYSEYDYLLYHENYLYDKPGNIIMEKEYGGGIDDSTKYVYNNAGKIIYKVRFEKLKSDTIRYHYTDSGYTIISPERIEKFNLKGDKTEDVNRLSTNTIIWNYDEKGRIIEESRMNQNHKPELHYVFKYDSFGNMYEEDFNDNIVTHNKYDSKGRKIESIATGTSFYQRIISTYDKHDNLTEAIVYNVKENQIPSYKVIYKYTFYK